MTNREVVLWGVLGDTRPIVSIDVSGRRWLVGDMGVTVIEPYLERGGQIWFAVFYGDEVVCRVNSVAVDFVCYCTK